ncbi:MAG: hypothetical protein P9M06_06650 [Candidatus Saelkia tenebricola]|nr:hypothetical protein [Candidatus Saelkia tenebricola]
MVKRLIIFSLVIIAIVVVVLFSATKISSQENDSTVVKEIEINREQKDEDLTMAKNQSESSSEYVENEVMVKFKEELSDEEINSFLSDYSLQILSVVEGINVFQFKTPQGVSIIEIVEELNKDSRVEYAEPNYIFKIN